MFDPIGKETSEQIAVPQAGEKGQLQRRQEGVWDNGSYVICLPGAGSPRTQTAANSACFLCPYWITRKSRKPEWLQVREMQVTSKSLQHPTFPLELSQPRAHVSNVCFWLPCWLTPGSGDGWGEAARGQKDENIVCKVALSPTMGELW